MSICIDLDCRWTTRGYDEEKSSAPVHTGRGDVEGGGEEGEMYEVS